jgi:hypothetical protein
MEHKSDCALHNEPAFTTNECDCGAAASTPPPAAELLPCPECGHTDPSERVTLYGFCSAGNSFTLEKVAAYIECKCFRRTGVCAAKTREDALVRARAAWNTRADLAELTQLRAEREIQIEAVAETIYNVMPYTLPGSKPKWVPGGNSFKQNESRALARAALNGDTPQDGTGPLPIYGAKNADTDPGSPLIESADR